QPHLLLPLFFPSRPERWEVPVTQPENRHHFLAADHDKVTVADGASGERDLHNRLSSFRLLRQFVQNDTRQAARIAS
ncbi:hypothetical protein, partial [Salmonella enterica]|uniref:hypothetical protein n=1 Tax=Salmonella enterica TaxID=28901 RepID=UPI003D769E06